MQKRVIFHIDVNSAFLSWSAVKKLKENINSIDLRTIPSAVGGDVNKRRGIILAKSIPAKKYGVKTGEPLFQARNKCPSLEIIPPDYELYIEQSNLLFNSLKEYSPLIQRFSVDECFLDYTGMEPHFGEPIKAADMIREKVKKEFGWTVNIGIGPNKLLAKMASDFKKPDRIHTLFKNELEEKMWPLPVSDLYMVGRSTSKTLHELNINTIGELAHADISLLEYFFKSHGRTIRQFANGYDDSAVVPNKLIPVKGFSNSTTTAQNMYKREDALKVLLSLCDTVTYRMRRQGFTSSLVSVQIKYTNFEAHSMQKALDNPADSTMHFFNIACSLFDDLWDGRPLRHLGMRLSDLSPGSIHQIYLFEPENINKLRKIDNTIDKIKTKYGMQAINRAAYLEMPLVRLLSASEDTPLFGMPF